jgi:DNA replication protein DnaC
MMNTNRTQTKTVFPTPTDWKSENWWRNRSAEERLFHAKIPPRLSKISYDEEHLTTNVLAWLSDYEPGSSLYIHGRPGSGKSLLAQEVLRRVISSHPLSGRFVSADRYLEMLKDQFDNDNLLPSMYSSPYLIKYIQGVFDVLVLDGVGQERETEFANHEIGSLIRRRYEDLRTVIVTSTLSTMDFTRRYGDRIKSAVMDMTEIRVG